MSRDIVNNHLLDCIINDLVSRDGHDQTLHDALHIVSAIARSGLVILPERPSEAMLAAGAVAGNVSRETVRSILDAVIDVAE